MTTFKPMYTEGRRSKETRAGEAVTVSSLGASDETYRDQRVVAAGVLAGHSETGGDSTFGAKCGWKR